MDSSLEESRETTEGKLSEGDWKRHLLSVALLLSGLLAVFVFLMVVIPTNIKGSLASGEDSEELAKAKVNELVQQQLSSDMMQQAAELAPGKPAIVNFNITGAGAPEDLRFARSLVTKGKVVDAIRYYEGYLKQSPTDVEARLELINAYLQTKKLHSARLLCISTLKQQLKSEQIGAVWKLMSQCQTD